MRDKVMTRRRLFRQALLAALGLTQLGRLQAVDKLAAAIPLPGRTHPGTKSINLPRDFDFRGLTVEDAIRQRRSVRRYANQAISLLELSRLLYYASGITDSRRGFRAAPSAGATYPIELYAVVSSVTGLAPGIYHYTVREHGLELVTAGDFSRRLTDVCLGQHFVAESAVAVVMTGVFERTARRYGKRGAQYVYMEIGYIGENLYLTARSMGMGACAVGAFNDDKLARLLDVDGREEVPLLVTTIGKLTGSKSASTSLPNSF